jgi:hypothetical protein
LYTRLNVVRDFQQVWFLPWNAHILHDDLVAAFQAHGDSQRKNTHIAKLNVLVFLLLLDFPAITFRDGNERDRAPTVWGQRSYLQGAVVLSPKLEDDAEEQQKT